MRHLVFLLLFACRTPQPQPKPETKKLFLGVDYTRSVRASPRPLVIHHVWVDLSAPGIEFLVTPRAQAKDRQLSAQTTSQYLQKNRLQPAINAAFFRPFYAFWPFGFYPQMGEGVDVLGLMISRGHRYSKLKKGFPILSITKDNKATIGPLHPSAYNAISGYPKLITQGEVELNMGDHASPNTPSPRTAVGLNKDQSRLLLVIVDGRQSGYSEGMTLHELAVLMQDLGATEAMNLDGGGSTTLVIEDRGVPKLINSPIHYGDPKRERPIGNHLGLFAYPQSINEAR